MFTEHGRWAGAAVFIMGKGLSLLQRRDSEGQRGAGVTEHNENMK